MRIMPLLKAASLSLMLSACVAPLLMMSPTSQLMWALLKPLVGFNPNDANLFEQPLVKDRMTAILGPNYDTTMQLLKTANKLQQQGPLFYVLSEYAPMPDIAKRAGMMWNSQTNQMSVLLQKGDGTTQTFGENLAGAAPVWPTAMQGWQEQGNPLNAAAAALTGNPTSQSSINPIALGSPPLSVTGSLADSASQAISSAATNAIGDATQAASQGETRLTQSATTAVTTSALQAVNNTAATVMPDASKAVAIPAKQAVSRTTAVQETTKAVTSPATQTASSATVAPAVTNAVVTPVKQATSGATVTQEMVKSVASPVKQAIGTTPHKAGESIEDAARGAETEARAKAEVEMEALLK